MDYGGTHPHFPNLKVPMTRTVCVFDLHSGSVHGGAYDLILPKHENGDLWGGRFDTSREGGSKRSSVQGCLLH